MRRVGALAVVAIAGLSWVAIELSDGGAGARLERAVRVDLRRAFSILRTPPEATPPALRRAVELNLGRRAGMLDFDSAQRVDADNGVRIWVIPGHRLLCVVQDATGAIGCDSARRSVRKGVQLVLYNPLPQRPAVSRYLALGVVPDGVKAMRLRTAEGTRSVPVKSNVYSRRSDSPVDVQSPASIEYTTTSR